jgi:ribose transport system substrate-binding protein
MRRDVPVWLCTALMAVVGGFVLAGCGSKADSPSPSGTSVGAPPSARADLSALYSADAYKPPPPKSPKPEPGKKIALLSCGQSVAFCKDAIAGAQEAADSIGWTTTVIDSKGDANIAQTGIRQAIAAGVDGIYVEAFDCQYLKAALQEAKNANIPVVAEETRDCNENLHGKVTTGPSLLSARVNYPEGDLVEWLHKFGEIQAEYMIAKTGGNLNVVSFGYSDLAASLIINDAFQAAIAKCGTCKNTQVGFTVAEAGSSLQQKVQQALLKNPDANYIRADSDGTVLNGLSAANEASGRNLPVMGSEGNVGTMDLARKGKDIGGIGIAVEWFGYAGIDILNRVFHGQQPAAAEGPGLQVWDRKHNLPSGGAYQAPIDFRAGFKTAWGVG